MTSVLRYLTGFFSADTHQPGLIQKLDGTVWLVNPDGSETQVGGDGVYTLTRRPLLFTETLGAGVYLAEVVVPPGTSLLDVAVFCLSDGPWNGDTAVLSVYDSVIGPDTPYIDALDLIAVMNQAYDPLTLQDAGPHQQWTDPGEMGSNVLKYTTSLYFQTGGAASSVRFPNGGTITAVVTTTGDYATGAIAAAEVASGLGEIIASTLNDGGGGYDENDEGTISGGSGGTYRVVSVDGDGVVLTYEITSPGFGYSVGVAATTPSAGAGSGLVLNITEVVADIGGSSYAEGDTGTIGDGGATYVVDSVDDEGSVLTFAIVDAGDGYSVPNDVTTAVTTGGGDGAFVAAVTAIKVAIPGQVVVDLIGFGIPTGPGEVVKTSA